MKRILIIIALIAAVKAQAQTWSLDSCVQYAIDHNINVRSTMIQLLSGEQEVTAAKDRFLPNLSVGANQSWDFGRGLTADNTYANRNTSMFGVNASLSLPVFQGLSNIRQLKYARTHLAQLLEQSEAAKDDVTLSVMAQYLQTLYSTEISEVSLEQLHLSQLQAERQRVLFDNGKVAEADLLQSQAQVARDELSNVNADNDRKLALIDLARLLELKDLTGFDITPLTEEPIELYSPEDVYEKALANNHTLRSARLGVELANRQIALAQSGYLPRISFSAGLGSSYYHLGGIHNPTFNSQMRDNFSKSLGFNLQIPIFDAFNTRNQVRQARIQRLNASLEVESRESALFKDIRQAYYQAVAAAKKFEASKIASKASEAALQAMTDKYEYGKATATEWEQAKTDYIKSRSETVQAKYELILRNKILAFYSKE